MVFYLNDGRNIFQSTYFRKFRQILELIIRSRSLQLIISIALTESIF